MLQRRVIGRSIGSGYCGLAACILLSLSTIRYDKAVVAVCLAFCILYWRQGAAIWQRHRGLVIATLALIVWIAALTLLRSDHVSRLLFFQYASFAACFLASMVALDRVDHPARTTRIVLLFGVLTVIAVFLPPSLLHSDYLKVFHPFGIHKGRWTSIFNNPNNFGILMATGVAFAAVLWLERSISTAALLAAAAIFMGQIYLSGSRNALMVVAAVALLTAFALAGRGRSRVFARARTAAGVATGVAIAIVVAAVAAAVLAPENQWGRSLAAPLGLRQIAWVQFPQMVLEHPLLGTSAQKFLAGNVVAHGHNLLLTLAVEWGLVGLALCLLWAWQFYRAATWTLARLIAVLPFVLGQVIDDFHFFRTFGLFGAMVAAWCVAAPSDDGRDRPNIGRASE